MSMLQVIAAAVILVLLTVWLQCAGMAALIYWGRPRFSRALNARPASSIAFMVRITVAIIGLHMLQILLWAGFYRWIYFPSWESAFYFSTGAYSTVGSGEVELPWAWKDLGPVESIIGVLMCGLSVSLVFAVVTRLVERRWAPHPPGTSGSN
jgi:voltage-gated potassium channel